MCSYPFLCAAGGSTQLHLTSEAESTRLPASVWLTAKIQPWNIVSPAAIFSCNVSLIARSLLCRFTRHSICHARWLDLKQILLPAHVIVYQRRWQPGPAEMPSFCRPRSDIAPVSSSLVRGVYVVHEHVTLEQYEQQKMVMQCDTSLVNRTGPP